MRLNEPTPAKAWRGLAHSSVERGRGQPPRLHTPVLAQTRSTLNASSHPPSPAVCFSFPLALPSHLQPSPAQGTRTPGPNPRAMATSGWLPYLASAGPADQGLSQGHDPVAKDLVTSLPLRLLGQLLCLCPRAQAFLSFWSPWFSQITPEIPTPW